MEKCPCCYHQTLKVYDRDAHDGIREWYCPTCGYWGDDIARADISEEDAQRYIDYYDIQDWIEEIRPKEKGAI